MIDRLNIPGSGTYTFKRASHPTGIYFYVLQDNSGANLSTGKLVIK
jgi:hypothetical protein